MSYRNNVLQMIDQYQELKRQGVLEVDPTPIREITTEYMDVDNGERSTQIKIVEAKRYADGTHVRAMRVMEPHKQVQV